MSLFAAILLGSAFAQDPAPEPSVEVVEEDSEPSTEDLARAKELFTNGKTLFDEGSYADAITAWKAAYKLSKREALLFNIASAAERIGQYDDALHALNQYRAFAKEDEKETLNRRMRNLERQRDEAKAKADAEAAAKAAKSASEILPTVPTVQPKQAGMEQRIAGGVLIGVGVAALGTGVALGIVSNGSKKRGSDQCLDSGLCPFSAQADLKNSGSQALIADVAMGLGVLSAVVGTVVLVTAPSGTVSVGANSIQFNTRF